MNENKNRQQQSSDDLGEYSQRYDDAQYLVEKLVARYGDLFEDPEARLDFISHHTPEEFLHFAKFANAKLRGDMFRRIRHDETEVGTYLPYLHTPVEGDKPAAFARGYDAITEYIQQPYDSIEQKIENTAMAIEALTLWVHPFNDGNGRTSRFLAKLIEDGVNDPELLIDQTVSGQNRPRAYTDVLPTKEGMLELADNLDIMWNDEEREDARAKAEQLPNDIEGMYLNIKRLLQDATVRERALRHIGEMPPDAFREN